MKEGCKAMKSDENPASIMRRANPGIKLGTLPRVLVQLFLLSSLLYHILCPTAAFASEERLRIQDTSDFLERYDPGIPASVSLEWDLPSGFSLGISGGHKLGHVSESAISPDLDSRMNLFPFAFLMKVPIYETPFLSQSMGFGIGPYFVHQGQVPIAFGDLEVTGMTTCLTEWVSQVSENLFLHLKMKYTQAFETMQDRIPDRDFSTWLGLKAHW
jgi:hypothetical protein